MLGSLWLRRLLIPSSPGLRSPRRQLMDLQSVVAHLKALAPLALAESWDNVGLLVEPSPPHRVHKLLLTNDLTEEVLEEALGLGANLVLSYHPPLFKALKRLTAGHWKERLVVRALENRLAVYSPHTACDALRNGVNDWLGRALGPCVSVPIRTCTSLSQGGDYILEFGRDASEAFLPRLRSLKDAHVRTYQLLIYGPEDSARIRLSCSHDALLQALAILSEDPSLRDSVELIALQKPPSPDTGMGRLCTLPEPLSISTAVEHVKGHLGLAHLRLALGKGKTLESSVRVMAVCAGSGSSILGGVPADLYLTGEMSHHEVLDAVQEGRSVILCEHSNSERGYLKELRGQIAERLEGKVEVVVSEKDRDPILVV